jgi:hypothetical protein
MRKDRTQERNGKFVEGDATAALMQTNPKLRRS